MEMWNGWRFRQISSQIYPSAMHSSHFPRPFFLSPRAQWERSFPRFCAICVLKFSMKLIRKVRGPGDKASCRPGVATKESPPGHFGSRAPFRDRAAFWPSAVASQTANVHNAPFAPLPPPNRGDDKPSEIKEPSPILIRKSGAHRGLARGFQRNFALRQSFRL